MTTRRKQTTMVAALAVFVVASSAYLFVGATKPPEEIVDVNALIDAASRGDPEHQSARLAGLVRVQDQLIRAQNRTARVYSVVMLLVGATMFGLNVPRTRDES